MNGKNKEKFQIMEEYSNKTFLHLKFPDFWENAYKKKNNFYKHVFNEAKMHSNALKLDKECYENGKCALFWHRHCDFCFTTITLDMSGDCYCSENGDEWICSKCFDENKKTYSWKEVSETYDVENSFKEVGTIIAANVR